MSRIIVECSVLLCLEEVMGNMAGTGEHTDTQFHTNSNITLQWQGSRRGTVIVPEDEHDLSAFEELRVVVKPIICVFHNVFVRICVVSLVMILCVREE
jgi:hypothetical protein